MNFSKRTITRDLLMSLISVITIIVLISGTIYYIYSTSFNQDELNGRTKKISEQMVGVLVSPLWNMDIATIEHVSEAYLSSEFVAGLVVKYRNNVIYSEREDDLLNSFVIKKKIIKAGEVIGEIEILFSRESITKKQQAIVREILLFGIIIIIVVAFTTYFIMNVFLITPLETLIYGVRRIAGGDYKTPLAEVNQQDINKIITEINSMAVSISKREEEMVQLKKLMKNVIDSMPSVLIGIDPDAIVTFLNHEAEKLTGITSEAAVNKSITAVFPELTIEIDTITRAIRESIPLKDSNVSFYDDSDMKYSDITVYPLVANGIKGAVIRIDDVSDRVRMQETMVQTEKMLSVGGLAAGMAHEINNPLAGILQNIQVMRNRISGGLSKNEKIAEECGTTMEVISQYMEKRGIYKMVQMMMEAGQRAAVIVDNMLTFSRRSDSNFKFHDIAKLLDKTIDIASSDYDLKKKYDFRITEIIREFELDLGKVNCEGSEIQQVFLNILKNGAQAMAFNKDKKRANHFIIRTMKENDGVRIEIEDNGSGMDEATRKRIFEPFFTTKEVGVGTGLGLSVSYFIITENHGGSMFVESTPGKGAKFVIILPFQHTSALSHK